MLPGADLDKVLERALAAKLETRRALARLPYEEKIRRMLRMQVIAAEIRAARQGQDQEPASRLGQHGGIDDDDSVLPR